MKIKQQMDREATKNAKNAEATEPNFFKNGNDRFLRLIQSPTSLQGSLERTLYYDSCTVGGGFNRCHEPSTT